MSHDEGHGDSHEKESGKEPAAPRMDKIFKRIESYVTKSISAFVAFLFVLVSIGAILGYVLAQRKGAEFFVLLPAIAGLVAYYNRAFAVGVLAIVVIIILFL